MGDDGALKPSLEAPEGAGPILTGCGDALFTLTGRGGSASGEKPGGGGGGEPASAGLHEGQTVKSTGDCGTHLEDKRACRNRTNGDFLHLENSKLAMARWQRLVL